MASTLANVVNLASLERTEEEQIDEEHILQAISAKHSGKKEADEVLLTLSLIHISEPTRHAQISYAVFCLKKKKNK